MYYLYIVTCADRTLYTGITTDLLKRVYEHNRGTEGAKYTRSRRPVRLSYSREFADRGEASKEEYKLKQLSRVQKLALIEEEEKAQKEEKKKKKTP
jgi:putative endonuclease